MSDTPDALKPTPDLRPGLAGGHSPKSAEIDPDHLRNAVRGAEYLLDYAMEKGIVVDADVVQQIIVARCASPKVCSSSNAPLLVSALTKLAAQCQPVTA